MTRRKRATFAELVADVTKTPAHAPRVAVGLNRDGSFGGPDGERFELVRQDLTPIEARQLVAQGALVVVDACGCGAGPGSGCELLWLLPGQLIELARTVPELHASNNGLAYLAEWRSVGGDRSLVQVAGEVSWVSAIG